MKIQPYLFFNGDCEEAFRFYEKALGGKINELHRFNEMPPQENAGGSDDGCGGMDMSGMGDKIMHASLSVGDQMIMGSDGDMKDFKPIQGVRVAIGIDDAKKGGKVFDALAEGGKVEMPYGETFWAQGFGMCTDKFGVPWMVNAGDKPSP
ncbi:VOC family protein [Luteibacter yeojuensis]|uniref:VOC family protein n=1 Tax=Luteibacter yeojuensis TaxID=345309 RepID=A0A7X5QVZ5_9GAMM|nr:VOC family protein [Luteibacter yeojuensis]NID16435.1 VOC family protein [Luteibacter yeojuensis]